MRCLSLFAIAFFALLLVSPLPPPAFAQDEEPVAQQTLEAPVAPVPNIMEQAKGLALPRLVRVQDNPLDAGNAVELSWLLAESEAVALFGDQEITDDGTIGNWSIAKTVEENMICKEKQKKKVESDPINTYLATGKDGKAFEYVIYRAKTDASGKPEGFVPIATVDAGGEVIAEEFRFNEGAIAVYEPSEKYGYTTPGTRKVRFRFWQSFIDETAETGQPYLYRILVRDKSNSAQNAFAYITVATKVGDLESTYEYVTDFGPVIPELNAVTAEQLQNNTGIAPPSKIDAVDNPSDSGGAIEVNWIPSESDYAVAGQPKEGNPVLGYAVFRSEVKQGQPNLFEKIGVTGAGFTKKEWDKQKFKDIKVKSFVDIEAPGKVWDEEKCTYLPPKYSYVVAAVTSDGYAFSSPSGAVTSTTQWFDKTKLMFLILAIVISGAILWFINSVRSGKKLFIRKIAGLEAIDEAIGRATEMGRPILFIPGIQDMNDVQTVSAVIILGRISKTIAEYDTKLLVPTSRSLVMTTARETVKEAYLTAGRPDAYNDDMVTYLTDEQFGYVAGVNGIMVREKPATCFFLGAFFAESLILAETGNHIGAIQIAGTAMPSQLPFFIAACDYTLIGEELFAASAYLSHDPMQLGSLKGQDIGKLMAMLAILIGILLATIAEFSGETSKMAMVFEFFKTLFQAS